MLTDAEVFNQESLGYPADGRQAVALRLRTSAVIICKVLYFDMAITAGYFSSYAMAQIAPSTVPSQTDDCPSLPLADWG